MRFFSRSALLSAACLLAVPAAGQEPKPPAASDEIVVTGTREREQQVRDFVKALTPAPGGTIPRLIDAVCPAVKGLVPAQNDAVTARLRLVAASAGIKLAGPRCVPNMFVIATTDKRTFIEMLSAKQPYAFGLMTAREIRRLARSPGPAAVWQTEGPVDSSGNPLLLDEKGFYANRTTEAASRITTIAGRGFDAAAMVVETGALAGLTPVQLADYAAMRLFAKLDPARLPAGAPTTILTSLTTPMGSPVALTMTKWDLGFLRGLYGSVLNLPPTSHRSEIAGRLSRNLDAPESKSR